MNIRELFVSDITRDIPPVIHFHDQRPEKLAAEVDEYIFTGGWTESDPRHRRIPVGIHEEYVRLLANITRALDEPGGPSLPNAWISGFYGSGKSSFAKLLGMALDGVALPDGRSMAEAWLARDTTQRSADLQAAWHGLRQRVDPIACVFDVGGVARQDEHVHTVVLRNVQRRLGYCSIALVANFELKLQRDGHWDDFLDAARAELGEEWDVARGRSMADDDFSQVLHRLFPSKYTDPMSWLESRDGVKVAASSVQEVCGAIGDMLRFRRPDATLFIVVDEVSQYVLASRDRVDRLRAFAQALGSTLRGRAWLVALGQQKLDEGADDSFLIWARDRFPPTLRVHLASSNIRDVVHQRLLKKKEQHRATLHAQFERNRADMKLYAYGCDEITAEDFVAFYPMLPGHIDLLLLITSALRRRSRRAQGDAHAIRGLLQLLGELFRARRLAEREVGALVTIDEVYAVQQSALDDDAQASMRRILDQCSGDESGLLVRVAQAVAMLELISETMPVDAQLVGRCLYDRIDRGSNVRAIREALEALHRKRLLSYSGKLGYKLQSTAGDEWEREKRDIGVSGEEISAVVRDTLKRLLEEPTHPRYKGRPFPWAGNFSDGRRFDDVVLRDPRDAACLRVDFRFIDKDSRTLSVWLRRTAESALKNRLVWVCGDTDALRGLVRELMKSRKMIQRFAPRRESLTPARQLLLRAERDHADSLEDKVSRLVGQTWLAGQMVFRGRALSPADSGFSRALSSVAGDVLANLFPHFDPIRITDAELIQLVAAELAGPSPKFLTGALGILELDAGRYAPTCGGVVPRRVLEFIEAEDGVSGTGLLAHFSGPPYGYTAGVIKACVAGLLRGGRLRIQPEGGNEITAIRDAGVRELVEKDRTFRRANLFPAGEDDIGRQARARICRFFKNQLGYRMDREDHAIADGVALLFPTQVDRLRGVRDRLRRLPGDIPVPDALLKLDAVLEQCVRASRQTRPTVRLVKKHLDALRDGVQTLGITDAELTDDALTAVIRADMVRWQQAAQLDATDKLGAEGAAALDRIGGHLATACPWRDISTLSADLDTVRSTYTAERRRLLEWQESEAGAARKIVKRRPDYSLLTGAESHHVLRPLTLAISDTSADAVNPRLIELVDPFMVRLNRAVGEANDLLDEIIEKKNRVSVAKVRTNLRNREVTSAVELEALLGELRARVLEHIDRGERVRLL